MKKRHLKTKFWDFYTVVPVCILAICILKHSWVGTILAFIVLILNLPKFMPKKLEQCDLCRTFVVTILGGAALIIADVARLH